MKRERKKSESYKRRETENTLRTKLTTERGYQTHQFAVNWEMLRDVALPCQFQSLWQQFDL